MKRRTLLKFGGATLAALAPLPFLFDRRAEAPRTASALKGRSLPIAISEVRLSTDPLTATARGALIAAMYEK